MIYIKENDTEKAAKILMDGKIIAIPTETVYGLAVLSTKKEYFDKLVAVKKRDPSKPFTLMISSLDQVCNFLEINETANKIIKQFMPGEITVILKTKKDIPSYLDLSSGFVGIRIPNKKSILSLIDYINKPLLVPSANPRDLTPAKNSKEVYEYFGDSIDAIVEGDISSNVPSTVIKIDGDNVTLIREGNIKFEQIKEVL